MKLNLNLNKAVTRDQFKIISRFIQVQNEILKKEKEILKAKNKKQDE